MHLKRQEPTSEGMINLASYKHWLSSKQDAFENL